MGEEYIEIEQTDLEKEPTGKDNKSLLGKTVNSLKKRIAEKKEKKRKEKEIMKEVYDKAYEGERKKFLEEKARKQATKEATKESDLKGMLSTVGRALDKVAQQAPKPGQRSIGQNIFEAMSGTGKDKKKKQVLF